jgi:hypothetical protein
VSPATAAADPTLAIAAYLKAQAPVFDATEGRVFRPELPEGEEPKMGEGLVVVRPAGGGQMFGRSNLPVIDSRLDVVCYGSTRLEAENIGREVQLALKDLRVGKWEEVKVYWARIVGGVASAIDPQTNWNFSLVTTQVMHSIHTIP